MQAEADFRPHVYQAASVSGGWRAGPLGVGELQPLGVLEGRYAAPRLWPNAPHPKCDSLGMLTVREREKSLLNKSGLAAGFIFLVLGIVFLSCLTAERDPMSSGLAVFGAIIFAEGLAIVALVVANWWNCVKSVRSGASRRMMREPRFRESLRSGLGLAHRPRHQRLKAYGPDRGAQ